MAQSPRKNSSVIVARSKRTIALPPATLGFASLVTPDTYDPQKPAFKANLHYTPAGIDALVDALQAQCIDANLAKLTEECEANKLKVGAPQDPRAWLEAKLKEPKENARVPLPHIVVMCRATFKDKQGDTQTKTLGCWDGHNRKLDLTKLRLGVGSVVQAVVHPNLFYSKLIGFPQPSLQLAGIRVLKLVQWGGDAAPQETDEDAIREVMGADFDMDDDLSAFAAGKPSGPASDEDKQSADDLVKDMF